MKRTWLALFAAAVLAGGCGGGSSSHYRVKHVEVVAAAFARRARILDRAHEVSSRAADLSRGVLGRDRAARRLRAGER